MIPEDKVKRNKHYRCLEYSPDQDRDIYLIACGKERCDPNVINGPDVRKGYHLHVILSGTGTLHAGGQTFHPHFGQMFLLKDQEEVTYYADPDDPWEYCWITFNGRDAKRMVEELGFSDGIYHVDSAIAPKDFFHLIYQMHEKPEMNYFNDLRRTGLMLEFLAMAMEATATQEKVLRRRNEHSIETYINHAQEFIHFNYTTISVNDVIEYIGFSRSYFTTVFKEYTGVSLQKYLLQYRMQKACEQLRGTDYTVRQISESVGYDNALTFSRSFKSIYGISPTDYRQKLTEKKE